MTKLYQIVTKVFKSKTLIVNWAALIAGTLALWQASPAIAEYPEIVAAIGTALAGINILLRFVTKIPLEDK
jgi:hypothetical protein